MLTQDTFNCHIVRVIIAVLNWSMKKGVVLKLAIT